MSKIAISADSTCDISPEVASSREIAVVPLHVEVGGEYLLDGPEITPERLFASFRETGKLPKTAAVSPDEFLTHFRKLRESANEVIHFSLSGEFSSCHQNALIAASEVDGVHCIDSRNLSSGIALQVLKAADLRDAGLSVGEIVEKIAEICPKTDASFVLDTLSFLAAGGRCSSIASIGASVLSIKPSIVVQNGAMHVSKKYMGSTARVLPKYVADRLEGASADPARAFVTHSGLPEDLVRSLIDQVKATGLFREVMLGVAGSTISSHCGPNCMGILFIHQ